MIHPWLPQGRRAVLAFVLVLALAACGAVDPPRDAVRVVPGGFATFPDGAVVVAPAGALEAPIDAFATPAGVAEGAFPPGARPAGDAVRFGALADVRAGGAPLAIGLPVPEGVEPERAAIAVQTLPGDATGRYLTAPVWEVLDSVLDAEGAVLLASVGGLAQDGRLALVVVGEGIDTPRLVARTAAAGGVEPAQAVAFEASCVGFDGPYAAATNPSGHSCTAVHEAQLEAVLASAYADFTGVGFRAPALARSVSILDSAASLADGVVELVYGPYEAQLRPYRPVAAGADTWGCGVQPAPNGTANRGGYAIWSETLFVCIDGAGLYDAQSQPLRPVGVARHEYFHTTQYAYAPVGSFARGVDLWVIEGTAVASENSLATMARDGGRPARAIDVQLTSEDPAGFPHYRAQDFFVFVGDQLGRGLEYLRFVFTRGGRGYDVDAALRESLGVEGGLAEMYWLWARHQAMNDSSVAAAACGPVADVADARTLSFTPNASDGLATGVLPSLTTHRHELVFAADADVAYQAEIRVVPDRTGVLRARAYAGDSGTAGAVPCAAITDIGIDRIVVDVPPGASGAATTVFVLVANTEPDPIQVHLGYRLEVRVRPLVVIEEPADATARFAEVPVPLRARITTPDPRVAALPIEWLATYVVPGQRTLQWAFESASGETLAFRAADPYCTGTLELEALVDSLSVTTAYANLRDLRTVPLVGRADGPLRAVIVAPPRPVHHLEIDPAALQVPPYTLRGYASQRRCGADGLPGATASWRNLADAALVQGTTPLAFEVADTDFADGSGGWRSLRLWLRVEADGRAGQSSVLLVPCAGRDGGPAEYPGVPTCPAAINGFWYDLDEAFETLAGLPTWQELDVLLNGRVGDLERALDLDGGTFPIDPATTLPLLDVAVPVREHLARLVDLLDAATGPEPAFAELDALDALVRGDEALVGVDADLYWTASGLVRGALAAFDRADPFHDPAGGLPSVGDAWARFAFVRDADATLVGADPVEPARATLAGLLTTATRRPIDEPVQLRAATLGALLGARAELQAMGYGER
jgi:hypothetical protein